VRILGSWTNPNTQQIVPLIQSGSLSAGSVVATINPAGGFQIVSLANVTQFASYDLNTYLYAVSPGGAASPIVALFQLQWFDDTTSGIPIFEEQWWIWVGRAPAGFSDNMGACGPMHGAYMTVNVSIPTACASSAILQYFNLFGSPRNIQYSDWRQDAFQVNPQNNGLTVLSPSTSGYENSLANIGSFGLAANETRWVPCNLYAGPVYYRFQASQVPNNDPVIAAADNITASGIVVGTSNPMTLVNITNDANEHFSTFIAPRVPMYFVIHGNAGAASNFSFNMTGQQAA
jgi:hypothetical protein